MLKYWNFSEGNPSDVNINSLVYPLRKDFQVQHGKNGHFLMDSAANLKKVEVVCLWKWGQGNGLYLAELYWGTAQIKLEQRSFGVT